MTNNGSYPCPCCGNKTIDEPGCYEICPVCGWEGIKKVRISDLTWHRYWEGINRAIEYGKSQWVKVIVTQVK